MRRPATEKRWEIVVGLTGGLGSGKSTVLEMFKKKGALTLDADRIVTKALKQEAVLKKIRSVFGPDVFDGVLNLNKSRLARRVFQSPRRRKQLEQILHPIVRRTMKSVLAKRCGLMAVCDVPLLYEKGWESDFDRVVVVNAPKETRLRRLMRRGFTSAQSQARMKAQWPLREKIKRADFVVRNDGSKVRTQAQVDALWKFLTTPSQDSCVGNL